jgi:hypothetical protein
MTLEQMKAALQKALEYLKSIPTPRPDPLPTPPSFMQYDFSTPEKARHSVRVLCDELGLPLWRKDRLCQVIRGESGFDNSIIVYNCRVGGKIIPIRSTKYNEAIHGPIITKDIGIAQINNYWNIGPNRKFPSEKYVLENPEKVIRWMIAMESQGKLSLWVAFSSGAYANYKA